MSPSPHDDDGVPHDAWLREALRHAPDADALPPSALSETILRQARAATAAASKAPLPTPSFGARLAAAWAWLGRPPVAAGFASVMVAGVVGLMWWERPLEQTLPPRDVTIPAAAPAPEAVAAAPAAPAAPPVEAATPPADVAAKAPARRAEALSKNTDDRRAVATTTAPRAAPAVETATAKRAEASPQPAAAGAVGAAAAPPAAPAPAQTALADAAPATAAEPRPVAAESESRRTERIERAERALAGASLSKAVPAPSVRRDMAAAAATTAPLAALRSAIAAQPDRWRWQREGTGPRAVDAALSDWLAQADAATGSRWQPPAAESDAVRGETTTPLQLWLDGRLHTTLRLGATRLVAEPASDAAARQRAELPAEVATALRAALEQATR